MSRFRRRLMGLAALRQAKADDFVRVEYLENVSNAYIDTFIKPNNNTKIEVSVELVNIQKLQWIYGARNNQQNSSLAILYGGKVGTGNLNYGYLRYDFGDKQNSNNNFIENKKWKISNESNVLTYTDGTEENTYTITCANNSFTCNYNLYLFNLNNRNTISNSNAFLGKVYYFKIYNDGELVRDFIPMYQISTDTYGLWDRVKEEFYTSPNGVKFTGGERYDTTDIIEVHPKLIANTYINENSGAQQNYGGWSSSDYIDVEGFKYIQVPYPFSMSNYKYGAYYDKDKNRISNTASLTIPSNAKYVRLSTVTSTFTNVWLFKRQLIATDIYRANSYIETNGSIRAYNGWNIFNTESVYNYFYCWIYSQSYRYQASYNADGSVYQSGKGFLERPEGGKVLLSDSNTSITYYAGYNYEYKNMNE